jgi:phage I-like protein
MNLAPILNRAIDGKFALPADGWYHIAPNGEYPHPETGAIQILDPVAASAIINRFQKDAAVPSFPGILIDYEHFSYDRDKPSTAAGWITELANRDDGIWGKIRWSERGLADVQTGAYRFLSPVWLSRDTVRLDNTAPPRLRPLRLDSAGLTNSPNLRGMVPLSNRHDATASPAETPKPKPTMNQLMTALGLSADASEQAAVAAVTKLTNRITELETELPPLRNRLTELETTNTELLKAEAEATLERYKTRIHPEKLGTVREQLIANRVATLALLDAMDGPPQSVKSVPSVPTILNRTTTPPADKAEPSEKIRAAVDTYRLKNRCTWDTAWDAVRRENPGLFA